MEGEEAGKWEMLAGQGINAVAEAGLRFYCNILFYGNSAARRLYRCIVDGLTDCHNSTINRPLSPFAIHPPTHRPAQPPLNYTFISPQSVKKYFELSGGR